MVILVTTGSLISSWSNIQATTFDEFKRKLHAAIEELDLLVDQKILSQREIEAPTQVAAGIEEYIRVSTDDLNQLHKKFKNAENDIQKLINDGNSIKEQIEALVDDKKEKSLSGFGKILEFSYDYSLTIMKIDRNLKIMEEIQGIVNEVKENTDTLCEREVARLDPNNLNMSPQSYVNDFKNAYPEAEFDNNSFDLFNFDKNTDDVAAATSVLSIFAFTGSGYFIYALLNKVAVDVLFSSFFSTISSSGGALVGVEASIGSEAVPAVVIFIAAIIIAQKVGDAINDHNNRQKRRKAEKYLKKSMERIESIVSKYENYRISKKEYETIGRNICSKHEGLENHKEDLNSSDSELENKVLEGRKALVESKDEDGKLNDHVRIYRRDLEDVMADSIIEEHLSKIKSIAKTTKGWEYFNLKIKNKWADFNSLYMSKPHACFLLSNWRSNFRQIVDRSRKDLEILKDEGNENDALFSHFESTIKIIFQAVDKKIDRCQRISQEEYLDIGDDNAILSL